MGDYSDNPKEKLDDAVKKDYVGVRLQQGVPILDSDWNLMEDLRRHETEEVGKWFIGDGVPTGSDGFRIFSTNGADNFGIGKGICIVAGKTVKNPNILTYKTQPHYGDGSITPPIQPLATLDLNMQYVVYLDTWEIDVDSESDGNIMNETIGVETAVRVKRDWAVRVARTADDLAALDSPPEGHYFYRLARLLRNDSESAIIKDNVINDLRFTQLSVFREIEVYNAEGEVILNTEDYERVITNTRDNFRKFIQYIATHFNEPENRIFFAEILGLQTGERIAQVCDTGMSLLHNKSLGNYGAVKHLYELYLAEQNFINTWINTVLQLPDPVDPDKKKYRQYEQWMNYIQEKLGELLLSIENKDLPGAVKRQEEIALLIGIASHDIPRGYFDVMLKQSPEFVLSYGQEYIFVFLVKSFTTRSGESPELDTYSVALLPGEESPGWERHLVDNDGNPLPQDRFQMGLAGSEAEVRAKVKVGSEDACNLQLLIKAEANPLQVYRYSGVLTMEKGEEPPEGKIDVYFQLDNVSTTFDEETGELLFFANESKTVEVHIWNATAETLDFTISKEIISDGGAWDVVTPPTANNVDPNQGSGEPERVPVRINPSESNRTASLIIHADTHPAAPHEHHISIKVNIRSIERPI